MRKFKEHYKSLTWSGKQDLAKQLGVHYATLSNWAHGKRTPDLAMAFRIEEVTGVSVYSWRQSVYVDRELGILAQSGE